MREEVFAIKSSRTIQHLEPQAQLPSTPRTAEPMALHKIAILQPGPCARVYIRHEMSRPSSSVKSLTWLLRAPGLPTLPLPGKAPAQAEARGAEKAPPALQEARAAQRGSKWEEGLGSQNSSCSEYPNFDQSVQFGG